MAIVTLCGSMRYRKWFDSVERLLVKNGHTVLVPSYAFNEAMVEDDPQLKELLDKQHKAKINISTHVFIVDVDGYVGESTEAEIEHANHRGLGIHYLSATYSELMI